jgi:hypothetical protein
MPRQADEAYCLPEAYSEMRSAYAFDLLSSAETGRFIIGFLDG